MVGNVLGKKYANRFRTLIINADKNVVEELKKVVSEYKGSYAIEAIYVGTLGEMEDLVFDHHVNDHKNDFVPWVKEVFDELELAEKLGAATACSRPVADIEWRPHHEHVGQTGTAIRPNLYIAVGISGAIQHLAGVNGSKVIVVIITDPEAPFFKAADYGIVGDAFDVVPKLVASAPTL